MRARLWHGRRLPPFPSDRDRAPPDVCRSHPPPRHSHRYDGASFAQRSVLYAHRGACCVDIDGAAKGMYSCNGHDHSGDVSEGSKRAHHECVDGVFHFNGDVDPATLYVAETASSCDDADVVCGEASAHAGRTTSPLPSSSTTGT